MMLFVICTYRLKKSGIIKVSAKNYKNEWVSEYWHVYPSKDVAVETNEPVDIGKVEEINEEPNNTEQGGYAPGGNTQNGGTYTYEPVIVQPNIDINVEKNGDDYTAHVTIDSCEDAKIGLIKRINPNISSAPDDLTWNDFVTYNSELEIPYVEIIETSKNDFYHTFNSAEIEEGIYDIVALATNEANASSNSIAIGPYNLGGQYATQPTIKSIEQNFDYISGIESFKITSDNCTELKYKFIKRAEENVLLNKETLINAGYDKFDGTRKSGKDVVSMAVDPEKTGSGVYDLVIWQINKNTSVYNLVIKTIVIDALPKITISADKETTNNSKWIVNIEENNSEKIEKCYYYVCKQEYYGETVKPALETIKNPDNNSKTEFGGELNVGNNIITIDMDTYGDGYYSIFVYAEKTNGKGRLVCQGRVIVNNSPEIKCVIQGEAEDAVCSIKNKSVQKVDVTVTDKDGDEELQIAYFEDTRDNISYHSNSSKAKTITVKNGETATITMEATDGEDVNKYLYIRVMDRHSYLNGGGTFYRTGSIRLDGASFVLDKIYADKEINTKEKVGYGLNDELKVTLQFNHDIEMAYEYPDLYMNFGTKEKKQYSTSHCGNKITYSYKIEDENGDITIGHLDNSRKFKEDGSSKEYSGNIKEDDNVENFIDGYYYVDTIKPSINTINIKITADEEKIKENLSNKTKYIKEFDNLSINMECSEPTNGNLAQLSFIAGNKGEFSVIYPAKLDESTKLEMIMTDTAQQYLNKYEGELKFNGFKILDSDACDQAGNAMDYSNYDIKYFVNGEEIPSDTKLIFDNNTSSPELYVGNIRIAGDCVYSPGTEFTEFTEFKNALDSADASNIKSVEFEINYYSENTFPIYDNKGEKIEPNETTESTEGRYDNVDKYILTTEQLPIKFTIEKDVTYTIKATKTDSADNKVTKKHVIKISDSVKIDKTRSYLGNSDEFYNYKELKAGENKYRMVLDLKDLVTAENIEVLAIEDGKEIKATFNKQFPVGRYTVAEYEFEVTRGGIHNIIVKNKEGVEILSDTVDIENLYIVGDANYDGIIDAKDVNEVLKYISAKRFETERVKYAGDLNGDGIVNAQDVVYLCRIVAGDKTIEYTPSGHVQL